MYHYAKTVILIMDFGKFLVYVLINLQIKTIIIEFTKVFI